MKLNEYQDAARATAVYPPSANVLYPVMALAEEAGEAIGKIAKILRKNGVNSVWHLSSVEKNQIAFELGDVMWQVAALAGDLGYSLEEVARMNLFKLADRAERGVLKGEGDDR